MTDLRSISDELLLSQTKSLAKHEREILTDVLHRLKEIERRRLFSSLKYGSLYDYAMKELGYTEDQAYRRIQAARLLKELPEIEEKINNGSLLLTHLSMAQNLFNREERASEKTYTKQQKIEVLEKLEKTSKREAQKIAVSLSSTPIIPQEKIRFVSKGDVEIKYIAKESHLDKIQKLKNMLSHKYPNLGLAELMELLVDLGLEKFDKTNDGANSRGNKGNNKANCKTQSPSEKFPAPGKVEMARATTPTPTNPEFIAPANQTKAQIRRNVWKRDKGQCQICNSRYAVEIDHRFPRALGGEDTGENLRLLCRSCNQREAINIFGQLKMDQYLNAFKDD